MINNKQIIKEISKEFKNSSIGWFDGRSYRESYGLARAIARFQRYSEGDTFSFCETVFKKIESLKKSNKEFNEYWGKYEFIGLLNNLAFRPDIISFYDKNNEYSCRAEYLKELKTVHDWFFENIDPLLKKYEINEDDISPFLDRVSNFLERRDEELQLSDLNEKISLFIWVLWRFKWS